MEEKLITYKILWIDDEYDTMPDFIELANERGLNIIPCRTSKKGLEYLKSELDTWDGIILDVKCLSGYNENETPTTQPMQESITEITKLNHIKSIPVFLWTANPNEVDKNQLSVNKIDMFQKGKAGARNNLFEAIRLKAGMSLENQIKKEYRDILEAYSEYESNLIKYLTPLQKKDGTSNVLNDIRSFFEDFRKPFCAEFHKIGISTEIKNLADLEWHFKYWDSRIVPDYIKNSFTNLRLKTNMGSHFNEDIKNGKLPYLVHSAIFDLLNILHWLKELPKDENSIKIYKYTSERKIEEQQEWENIKNQNIKLQITKDDDNKYNCTIKNPDMIKPEDEGSFFTINRSKLTKRYE